MINKYNNPRLHNTVLTGPGMTHPRNPHVVIGSDEQGFIQGDLMDANAIMETIDQKTAELVDSAPDWVTEQQQADWNLTNTSAVDYINNKPDVALKSDIYTIVGDANGHDYVEIGGIKWATMNVGATSETDRGLYFAWGDIQGYDVSQVGDGAGLKAFRWTDYKYANGTSKPGAAGMTKYNSTDGKDILELSDDAARENWGGTWRMPTKEELQVLINATNALWTTDYQGSGMNGYTFTDKTDSSKILFFPGVSYCTDGSLYGGNSFNNCSYWTSSISETKYPITAAHTISGGVSVSLGIKPFNRCCGRSVRAVLAEEVVPKFTTPSDIPAQVQSDWGQSDNTAVDYIKNKPTIPSLSGYATESWVGQQGYLTSHQDISGKEDKTAIESASGTTLSPSVNKYYRFSGTVNTLTVTLPVPTDSTHVASVILYFTAGSNPNVTITCPSDVYYSDGFKIEAGATHEVNCLWNGASWIVASVTIIVE